MIVTSATDILANCILELEKLSGKSESPPNSSFPSLPPVTEDEVSEMQAWMSKNKGVTFDGFSDNWFRKSNQKFLTNWWNNETISHLFPLSFEARLIPLNKAHPSIPNKQQFRPIIILSSSLKWLESRFKKPLQNYLNSKIDKDQIGFISDC